MTRKSCTDEDFIKLWAQHSSPQLVANALGISVRNVFARRKTIESEYGLRLGTENDQRLKDKNKIVLPYDGVRALASITGYVLVFSDAHFYPGEPSVGFNALLALMKLLKPKLVVANGDILDGSTIHSHGPNGWEKPPSLKQELDAVIERMGAIEIASKGAVLHRTIGNHDIRFDRRLASAVPEYRDIAGTSLRDHLPRWHASWSLLINHNTMVKHRINGGIHSGYNNTLKGGLTTVTGHTHLLSVSPWTDYVGRRWGVSTGMLDDPMSAQFRYAEDNPRPWAQGFAVLKYNDESSLLPPELCEVIDGKAYFRGEVVA